MPRCPTGLRQCTPTLTDPDLPLGDCVDFSSGYVRRSAHLFAKRGIDCRVGWQAESEEGFERIIALAKLSGGCPVIIFAAPDAGDDVADKLEVAVLGLGSADLGVGPG